MGDVKAVAWLHHVIDDAGDDDQALSFSPGHFPLEGVAGYRKVACEPLVPESDLAALRDEVAELREDLSYIERVANHHGQIPGRKPAQMLAMIQHYPPIKAITRGYSDGKVPTTPDPYERAARLEADNARLREALSKLDTQLDDIECESSSDTRAVERCQDTISAALAEKEGGR